MEFTKENILHLHHYCVEIADALRPILGTHNYNNAEPTYWIPKLTQFEKIISDILETPSPIDITVKSFGSEPE